MLYTILSSILTSFLATLIILPLAGFILNWYFKHRIIKYVKVKYIDILTENICDVNFFKNGKVVNLKQNIMSAVKDKSFFDKCFIKSVNNFSENNRTTHLELFKYNESPEKNMEQQNELSFKILKQFMQKLQLNYAILVEDSDNYSVLGGVKGYLSSQIFVIAKNIYLEVFDRTTDIFYSEYYEQFEYFNIYEELDNYNYVKNDLAIDGYLQIVEDSKDLFKSEGTDNLFYIFLNSEVALSSFENKAKQIVVV